MKYVLKSTCRKEGNYFPSLSLQVSWINLMMVTIEAKILNKVANSLSIISTSFLCIYYNIYSILCKEIERKLFVFFELFLCSLDIKIRLNKTFFMIE